MQLHNQAALLVWGLKAEQQNTHFDGKHAKGRCGVPTDSALIAPTAKPTKKEQPNSATPEKQRHTSQSTLPPKGESKGHSGKPPILWVPRLNQAVPRCSGRSSRAGVDDSRFAGWCWSGLWCHQPWGACQNQDEAHVRHLFWKVSV